MRHLSIQGVSLNKETLLNNLRMIKKKKEKKKEVLGSSSHLNAEASLPHIKAE